MATIDGVFLKLSMVNMNTFKMGIYKNIECLVVCYWHCFTKYPE